MKDFKIAENTALRNQDRSGRKTKISQAETKIGQTETKMSQAETKIGQPETQISQAETQIGQPKTKIGYPGYMTIGRERTEKYLVDPQVGSNTFVFKDKGV